MDLSISLYLDVPIFLFSHTCLFNNPLPLLRIYFISYCLDVPVLLTLHWKSFIFCTFPPGWTIPITDIMIVPWWSTTTLLPWGPHYFLLYLMLLHGLNSVWISQLLYLPGPIVFSQHLLTTYLFFLPYATAWNSSCFFPGFTLFSTPLEYLYLLYLGIYSFFLHTSTRISNFYLHVHNQ